MLKEMDSNQLYLNCITIKTFFLSSFALHATSFALEINYEPTESLLRLAIIKLCSLNTTKNCRPITIQLQLTDLKIFNEIVKLEKSSKTRGRLRHFSRETDFSYVPFRTILPDDIFTGNNSGLELKDLGLMCPSVEQLYFTTTIRKIRRDLRKITSDSKSRHSVESKSKRTILHWRGPLALIGC